MAILSRPAFGPRTALVYVTIGSLMDVWIRSTAAVDDGGKLVRWRCSALDLTERNRLADELRSRGDELELALLRLVCHPLGKAVQLPVQRAYPEHSADQEYPHYHHEHICPASRREIEWQMVRRHRI